MERKFLEGLGLDKDAVDKVMAEHGKGVEQQKTGCYCTTLCSLPPASIQSIVGRDWILDIFYCGNIV